MKRFLSLVAALCLALALCVPSSATDLSRNYLFSLTANGSQEIEADPGDVITLVLHLKRTDSADPSTMYAMQDEITYDGSFFELVEGSDMAASGIEIKDIALRDSFRSHYMSFVSFAGGNSWDADTMIGTFQLRVIGEHGSSVIENRNALVSVMDGSDSFDSSAEDVTVIVTKECTVHFETNGGTAVPDQYVMIGKKLKAPSGCKKEGFHVEGWYKDMDLQNEWNFKEDTVSGNMTLYAKWAEGEEASSGGALVFLVIAGIAGGAYYFFKKKRKEE